MADRPGNPYTFFGITTFGKVPHAPLEQDWRSDAAVLGVPFDQGVGFRSGARFGPKSIRDISVRYRLSGDQPGYWDLRTEDYKATCQLVDCGDVVVAPLDWQQGFENISRDVHQILERNVFPIVLGGDHSITFPVIKAFEGSKPLTIVHFDAHTDYRDQVLGVRHAHGSVIRRCCELPWITKAYSIGIRSLRTLREDVDALRERGNVLIPAWEVHEQSVDSVAERLPNNERVYITFDIDAMDPGIAPGTGTPEVGGLSYPEARSLLEIVCSRNDVVGFDLVEVNPFFDVGEVTSLLAVQIIVETLGFLRLERKSIATKSDA